jgi:hypothetical protein
MGWCCSSDPMVGDRAATLLARTDPDSAMEPLLAAMASPAVASTVPGFASRW